MKGDITSLNINPAILVWRSIVMAERTRVDKAKLYATLYNAYVAAYPKKSKQVCQQEFNVKWTELKKGEGLKIRQQRFSGN